MGYQICLPKERSAGNKGDPNVPPGWQSRLQPSSGFKRRYLQPGAAKIEGQRQATNRTLVRTSKPLAPPHSYVSTNTHLGTHVPPLYVRT